MPCVVVDDVKIGHLATRHLIQHGHRSILHMHSTTRHNASHLRHQGYLQAMEENDLEPLSVLIDNDFSMECTRFNIQQLLTEKVDFTAMFASTDLAAIGAIKAMTDYGCRVPDDIAVIGVGDLQEGQYIHPRLSTICQQPSQIGQASALAIIKLLSEDQPENSTSRIWIEPKLITRQSCGCQMMS